MKTFSLSILALTSLSPLHAVTIFDESTDGESSSSASTPTSLGTLALGNSDFSGQVGGGARDYYSFSVPEGFVLDSLTLLSGTGSRHFFGLDDALVFDESSFLIGTLYSSGTTESPDFLDTFASGGGFGGSGVTDSSLPAGDYSIFVNETATGSFDYQFRLTTAVVPEPSSWLLLGLGALTFATRRFR